MIDRPLPSTAGTHNHGESGLMMGVESDDCVMAMVMVMYIPKIILTPIQTCVDLVEAIMVIGIMIVI